VHALCHYTKYTPIDTRYTQTLENLLSKGMINPPNKIGDENCMEVQELRPKQVLQISPSRGA